MRPFFNLSPLISLISLPSSPFSSWSPYDECLFGYAGRTVTTSKMHAVCCNHPLIEYDQKNFAFHEIHQGWNPNTKSQTLKIMKGMSKRNQYLLPLNLPPLYNKKGTLSPSLSLCFLVIPTSFQMPEAILSSKFGSMVVSESVLLNRTKSNIKPIFVYYNYKQKIRMTINGKICCIKLANLGGRRH